MNELAKIDEEFELLPDTEEFDMRFKLIIIGDAGVGKSSILANATKHTFNENYSITVGFDFSSINFRYKGKNIKLQIWDTCGQEVYKSIITTFYKDSSLAIMVYAINE